MSMALMLQFGPFSAWITIDGHDRRIYGAERAGNTVSCWIASVAGKNFAVNWHNNRRDFPIEAVIYIDGVQCNRHVMLDATYYPNKPDAFKVSYAKTSEFTRRDFVFSRLQLTDDDRYLHTVDSSTDLGTIQLELWKIHVSAVHGQSQLVHQPGNILDTQIVHEQSKKAGSHHVKFGDEYVASPSAMDAIDGYHLDPYPIVTFTFKYRPIELLIANGIAPKLTGLESTLDAYAGHRWDHGPSFFKREDPSYAMFTTQQMRDSEEQRQYSYSAIPGTIHGRQPVYSSQWPRFASPADSGYSHWSGKARHPRRRQDSTEIVDLTDD